MTARWSYVGPRTPAAAVTRGSRTRRRRPPTWLFWTVYVLVLAALLHELLH